MYWNHRLIQVEPDLIQVCEVAYDDETNKPTGYSDAFLTGDTVEEIKNSLVKMMMACAHPILTLDVFKKTDGD